MTLPPLIITEIAQSFLTVRGWGVVYKYKMSLAQLVECGILHLLLTTLIIYLFLLLLSYTVEHVSHVSNRIQVQINEK